MPRPPAAPLPAGPGLLVDAHLDLAYSALAFGRDLRRPLDELRAAERREALEAMVTLPELRAAGTTLVFATLFTRPAAPATGGPGAALPGPGYQDAEEARALALQQLELYERWEEAGELRLVRTRADLEVVLAAPPGAPPGAVLLMENADPLRTLDELDAWAARGLRIVGPAWGRTRYAGGTGAPGGLTELGRELVVALAERGLALDVSHLADDAFWEALELGGGPLLASHSNARSLLPTDRHLSDAMLDALAARDAPVGLVLGNAFLRPGWQRGAPPPGTADVARQAAHLASRLGWGRVGLGTDLDGGFGRQETPAGLERYRDLPELAAALPAEARASVLGRAWLPLLERLFPAAP